MKKTISLLFVFGFCLLFTPCRAQEDYVKEKFEGYYKELVDFDKKIETADDVELYETRFETNKKFAESCFNEYTELIDNDKSLTKLYGKYKDLQIALGKRMEQLKEEKAQQEQKEKISNKLDRYLNQLTDMETQGKRFIENKRIDSLETMKKDAASCYQKALVDYGTNRESIEEDDDLNLLWGNIEQTNNRIAGMNIISDKIKIDGDDIFKICISLVALIFGGNLLVTKLKAKKPKTPKLPKKKKKEEDLPTI